MGSLDEISRSLENAPHVIGALLVGSYAVGLETSASDVDVCIIVTEETRRWRRGNILIDGVMIEYAFYPVSHLRYLEEHDVREGKRLRARMLATGAILFGRRGTLTRLKERAVRLLKRPLPRLSRKSVELRKYYLWDQLDNLEELKRRETPGFAYAYFAALQEVLAAYAAYKRCEIPRPARMHHFMTNADFRRRYGIAGIPDRRFRQLFCQAIAKPSLPALRRITAYAHERMGGFMIDGWALSGRSGR